MNPMIYVPVKVLPGKPGKEALDYFCQRWKQETKGTPFNGEYQIPASNKVDRLLSIDPDQISHVICDVRPETYDADKNTVMIGVRFTGPKGDDASDEYLTKRLRFIARTVKVKEGGKSFDRIITWDCVHPPSVDPVKQIKEQRRKR